MPEERIAKKRCAIYCRKSVEEGLEQEFNSLDAQREAGEAYILSQKANGWVCLPEHYDDGGYSGGNMKRPALQKLLKDCETGLVDIIVVYKIDRLSRSICDFADLSKKFDEWGMQFVSVTQEINTATPSGRMMLNILVTFSQYEREITAQRISDKMSASRKKGIWVGGTVPFGYVAKNKKLVIHEEDAKTVRHIFQRFIETQSPKLIAHELNLAGKRTKKGKVWNTSHIYRILNNHTYNGEVKYKENVCKGEQERIVSAEVWERTRKILAANSPIKDCSRRMETVAPLKGILKCGHCGGAMMPAYGRKNGRHYHYYLCCKDSKRAESQCPVRQLPPGEIEEVVKTQLKKIMEHPAVLSALADTAGISCSDILQLLESDFWSEISAGEYNRLVQSLVARVVVWRDHLEIEMKTAGIKSLTGEFCND